MLLSLLLDVMFLQGVMTQSVLVFGTAFSSDVATISLPPSTIDATIPQSISRLTNLRSLFASSNHLIGSLPSDIGECSKLEQLDLSTNLLVGTLPSQLGLLRRVTHLLLQSNDLSGNIPSQLAQLQSLVILDLSRNQFGGTIPGVFSNLGLGVLHISDTFVSGLGSGTSNLCDVIATCVRSLMTNHVCAGCSSVANATADSTVPAPELTVESSDPNSFVISATFDANSLQQDPVRVLLVIRSLAPERNLVAVRVMAPGFGRSFYGSVSIASTKVAVVHGSVVIENASGLILESQSQSSALLAKSITNLPANGLRMSRDMSPLSHHVTATLYGNVQPPLVPELEIYLLAGNQGTLMELTRLSLKSNKTNCGHGSNCGVLRVGLSFELCTDQASLFSIFKQQAKTAPNTNKNTPETFPTSFLPTLPRTQNQNSNSNSRSKDATDGFAIPKAPTDESLGEAYCGVLVVGWRGPGKLAFVSLKDVDWQFALLIEQVSIVLAVGLIGVSFIASLAPTNAIQTTPPPTRQTNNGNGNGNGERTHPHRTNNTPMKKGPRAVGLRIDPMVVISQCQLVAILSKLQSDELPPSFRRFGAVLQWTLGNVGANKQVVDTNSFGMRLKHVEEYSITNSQNFVVLKVTGGAPPKAMFIETFLVSMCLLLIIATISALQLRYYKSDSMRRVPHVKAHLRLYQRLLVNFVVVMFSGLYMSSVAFVWFGSDKPITAATPPTLYLAIGVAGVLSFVPPFAVYKWRQVTNGLETLPQYGLREMLLIHKQLLRARLVLAPLIGATRKGYEWVTPLTLMARLILVLVIVFVASAPWVQLVIVVGVVGALLVVQTIFQPHPGRASQLFEICWLATVLTTCTVAIVGAFVRIPDAIGLALVFVHLSLLGAFVLCSGMFLWRCCKFSKLPLDPSTRYSVSCDDGVPAAWYQMLGKTAWHATLRASLGPKHSSMPDPKNCRASQTETQFISAQDRAHQMRRNRSQEFVKLFPDLSNEDWLIVAPDPLLRSVSDIHYDNKRLSQQYRRSIGASSGKSQISTPLPPTLHMARRSIEGMQWNIQETSNNVRRFSQPRSLRFSPPQMLQQRRSRSFNHALPRVGGALKRTASDKAGDRNRFNDAKRQGSSEGGASKSPSQSRPRRLSVWSGKVSHATIQWIQERKLSIERKREKQRSSANARRNLKVESQESGLRDMSFLTQLEDFPGIRLSDIPPNEDK